MTSITGIVVWYVNYKRGKCVKVFDNYDQLREWNVKYSKYNKIIDIKAI